MNVKPEALTYDATSSWHNVNVTLIVVLNEKYSRLDQKRDFFPICVVETYVAYVAGKG